MEKKWNLNGLYLSFDAPELMNDLESLTSLIGEMTQLIDLISPQDGDANTKLVNVMLKSNQLLDLVERIYNFGSLVYNVDTSNIQAAKLIEKVQALLPLISMNSAKIKLLLKNIPNLDAFIKSEPLLENYRFVLENEQKAATYLLSEAEELLLSQMQNTGSSSWNKLQGKIVSTLTGSYQGKEETITVLRSKAYEPDLKVRKEAYDAEFTAYTKKDTESAACLNAIKGEVITIAKKRGYDSPLSMTLETSRMDKETLDAMLLAIKEYLPSFRTYLKKKAELLGHKNGLPFYDLFAPVGDVELRYTYDEARDFIVKQFSTFSPKLGAFAKNAFDQDWIDPFPREGKVAGAFCANLHSIKESRIMSNFTGSFNDMTTLAHELGHGYHGDCLNNALPLNSEYPMPLAETASIFCETIVFNAAIENATSQEAKVILENDLLGSTQVIVDIYSRYLFETALFEKRKEASLSVDELKEAMIQAQKEAYGDALDPLYLHPYMWMCKPHYYYATSNFYNFPYAFGLLFAKGLYAQYLKNKETFISQYDELLFATGCHNIHDVLAIVGINSHEPDFFRQSLELIKKDIEKFIAL